MTESFQQWVSLEENDHYRYLRLAIRFASAGIIYHSINKPYFEEHRTSVTSHMKLLRKPAIDAVCHAVTHARTKFLKGKPKAFGSPGY